MLIDKHNRPHNYLRISLTEKCNLRCTYCMPEEGVQLSPKERLMSSDEIFEMAKLFAELGVTKIRLTGGEPLLRRDVGEIIQKLSTLPTELTLTTNAFLVHHFIDDFHKAGIRSLNISLDTLNRERFYKLTKRRGFSNVMSNIELLIDEGFRVKVNVVLMRNENDDELLNFIEWTKNSDVHVRFIEFMPFDGNHWNWEKIVSFEEILNRINRHYAVEKLADKRHDTTKAYKVKGHIGTFAVISSMTNHFCASCNRLRLTADGKIRNCLFSNEEIDLITPFRNGENLKPLIRESLERKNFQHGGIQELEKLDSSDDHFSKRSMILIGG